jgi:hypothetical protein
MIDIQKFMQRNSRRILAFGALFASLFLFSLLTGAGPSTSAWLVRSPIAAGARISANEVELTKVDFGKSGAHYFGAKDLVIGQYAMRALAIGDLIATSDLSVTLNSPKISYLPIGVLAADISTDITAGQFADIYLIPKDTSTSPALVLSHVDIQSVDTKSRSLGGSVEIALSLNPASTALIVDAESQGRLVVARNAF